MKSIITFEIETKDQSNDEQLALHNAIFATLEDFFHDDRFEEYAQSKPQYSDIGSKEFIDFEMSIRLSHNHQLENTK